MPYFSKKVRGFSPLAPACLGIAPEAGNWDLVIFISFIHFQFFRHRSPSVREKLINRGLYI